MAVRPYQRATLAKGRPGQPSSSQDDGVADRAPIIGCKLPDSRKGNARRGKRLCVLAPQEQKVWLACPCLRETGKAFAFTTGTVPQDQMKKWYKQYQAYIKTSHWQHLRAARIKATPHCHFCQTRDNLHVHHIHYRNFTDCTIQDLVVLCELHHTEFHEGLDIKGGVIGDYDSTKICDLIRWLHSLPPEQRTKRKRKKHQQPSAIAPKARRPRFRRAFLLEEVQRLTDQNKALMERIVRLEEEVFSPAR